ncbi:hypothetical protein F2Q69_00032664 [Brassica cretica]|uniref:Uncharacterized protein n=1 Tax=Brassica cretica TaxID=69181 RepID=A0A8S9SR46_BRACR|nr:hypothetical protein F2Q69_00032664 [Brassica cretica]
MAISTLTLTSSHYTRSFRPTISSSSSSSSSFSCLCSSSSSSTDCQQKQRSFTAAKTNVFGVGLGLLAATILSITPLDADATRIEYYATVGDPLCEYSYAKSGLGFCDIAVGFGDKAPRGVLVNNFESNNVQAFGRNGKEKVPETSSVSRKLHPRRDHYTAAARSRRAGSAAETRRWRNQSGGRRWQGDDGSRRKLKKLHGRLS